MPERSPREAAQRPAEAADSPAGPVHQHEGPGEAPHRYVSTVVTHTLSMTTPGGYGAGEIPSTHGMRAIWRSLAQAISSLFLMDAHVRFLSDSGKFCGAARTISVMRK